MNKKINKSLDNIHLTIDLPSSKSISNRALILNALSYSPFEIENLSESDDTRTLMYALESNDVNFDIGAAGTSMRFLTAFLSKTLGEWSITGSERMKQRPIKILVDALNQLGAKIEYLEKEGFPPLKIFGSALMGGDLHLDGSVSSQYISALMMIAPYMQNGLRLRLTGDLISRPYVEMTASMMRDFGVELLFENDLIQIEPSTYKPLRFTVENDWSAASYWYEILSIVGKGELFLKGLKANSTQGDSYVAVLFEKLGLKTYFEKEGVRIKSDCDTVDFFDYNFVDQPDLAQTFAVCCCLKNIPFKFSGLQSLRIKETDRIAALITELKKAAYCLRVENDNTLIWDGEKTDPEKNISIATYDDHRMAMAFAPLGLVQPIEIENPQVVSKSYPKFWEDFDKI